jgi:hypothetical protein
MQPNNFIPKGNQSMKEKILMVGTTFPRWKKDKMPMFIYDYCLSIKDKYDVYVLAPHFKGAKRKEIMEGIHVYRFLYSLPRMEILGYTTSLLTSLNRNVLSYIFLLPFFVISGSINILKLLYKNKIHILHVHWIFPFGFIGALFRNILKIKLVIK